MPRTHTKSWVLAGPHKLYRHLFQARGCRSCSLPPPTILLGLEAVVIFSFRRAGVLKKASPDPSSAAASALFGTIPLAWLDTLHSRGFLSMHEECKLFAWIHPLPFRPPPSPPPPPPPPSHDESGDRENFIPPTQPERLTTKGAVAWEHSEPLKSLKSLKLPIESCVTPHSTSGTQTCISQFSVVFTPATCALHYLARCRHVFIGTEGSWCISTAPAAHPQQFFLRLPASDVHWAPTTMPLLPLGHSTGNMRGMGQVWHDAMALAPTSTISSPSSAHTAAMAGLYDVPLQTRESLGYNPDFNASAILARTQQFQLQIIASTFSSISIIAALCALYWFCMMRRNFRRDLVLLLLIGDFWKSAWFLIFSSTTLARGHIYTQSSFCQASGYFLQVGLEACDCAIFLMSLHMSLQIFPPARSFLGHDGLYRIRHFVIAGWFVVPNMMSALAFVNSGPAFISQGGFCSLPVRPIWYRLALSWIPRYLIWIFVMGVAIRIYRHVGFEFRVFGQENDQSSSVGIPNMDTSALNAVNTAGTVAMRRDLSSISDGAFAEKQPPGDDDVAPDDDDDSTANSKPSLHGILKAARFNEGRRSSVPTWSSPFANAPDSADQITPGPLSPTSKSLPSSRRGSKQIEPGIGAEDFAPPPPLDSTNRPSAENSSPAPLDTITEHKPSSTTRNNPIISKSLVHEENPATTALHQRRRAIQRQLRLLFIYPTIYLILWIIPFVAHALNYSNHFAQHPIYAISVISVFCQSIMGFADVSIFCWREKPWRHIPGSDGTFWGSFRFWRYGGFFSLRGRDERRRRSSAFPASYSSATTTTTHQPEFESSQTGLLGSIKRWSMSLSFSAKTNSSSSPRPSNASVPVVRVPTVHRRARSGGGASDRRVLESERAHERLALERAEYRRSLQEKRRSSVLQQVQSQQQQQQDVQLGQGVTERKECMMMTMKMAWDGMGVVCMNRERGSLVVITHPLYEINQERISYLPSIVMEMRRV
ncbi:uncharacterized protein MYCFIDRAFT_178412 [Pseudocercospora fijiensis CIRAD86]|uniref:Uncharacterized protein n=1 Tax=Pseudocercospora fijiensis (strain CIRAD86) TaxID=383855 RepID=M3AMB5_PSEFD|nr:uncharacterized protein MYCFIDRAFT_178412 [Pseudocercospora fijiensis CIRAD86]EME78248.1 hypothetical protein MYCFIDRAFT_178412 [Pseudocercospora fijiensis CIRAD86]